MELPALAPNAVTGLSVSDCSWGALIDSPQHVKDPLNIEAK